MASCPIVPEPKTEIDRRRYPRIPLDIPVNFYLGSGSEENLKNVGYTVDICPAGLLIKTEAKCFQKGQYVVLRPHNAAHFTNRPLKGEVRWVKKARDGCLNGISVKETEKLFLSFLYSISNNELSNQFLDLMLDAFSDGAFLVDPNLRIISVSEKQPLVHVDREKVRGEKVTEIPSVLKLFSSDQLNLRHDLQEVFYKRKDKRHTALSLDFTKNGEKKNHAFNISYRYLNGPPLKESVLIQVKDVTALYRLKENIERKNKDLFEQYRFTLMGQIVDELLEDLISPLSAVVGRIDLLKMKMDRKSGSFHCAVEDWIRELEIIDSLVDQITQHCTVAAKRREREKLGALESAISLNRLVEETIQILSVHERFRKIDLSLDLKDGLPLFKGEYFDWLNAIIAILQCLSREMQIQKERKLKIETYEDKGYVVLSISHNAKALKMPLERESGLAIFDIIQKKYKTAIETVGGNGRQKISFYIELDAKG